MTMLADQVDLVIGVDTHKHTNTAAVIRAATGGALEDLTVPTSPDGHEALLEMAMAHGGFRAWAIEGTNSYGAGLTRFLHERGERVIELDRPNRTARRGGKKSDPLDAVRTAREALGRPELGEPRSMGDRAALGVLLSARRSAIDARTTAQRQIHALVVAAPESLRSRFRSKTSYSVVRIAARLRVSAQLDLETKTTIDVLRSLARRVLELEEETHAHERSLTEIVKAWHPELLDECGVGPVVAATVLCAWSHPGRFRSDGAFASLAGVSPIPASSGLTVRHRLNRRGDRQLNRALHVVVINRIRHDGATQAYVERRRAEGKSDREIKRCLKRYVARQLFRQLEDKKGLDAL
ncbi:MAG: IS110 family transposase [Acidimicrobiales bacterium]